MIFLYPSTETKFASNGLGALDHDISDVEIAEEINGKYQLSFKYPLFGPHGQDIKPQMIVTAEDPQGNLQWFRIWQFSKSNGVITVTALHGTFDLNSNWIDDTNIVQKNGHDAMKQIQSMTLNPHPFVLDSDIQTVANARVVSMSPTQAIIDSSKGNTFISRWHGEIYRNWNSITMLARRGTDSGITLRYKKDILGYSADFDYTTIATVIKPMGANGFELPEKYVKSPNVAAYGEIVKEITYSDIKVRDPDSKTTDDSAVDEATASQMLRDKAQEELNNGLDKPSSNFKVDLIALQNTKEYQDFPNLQIMKPWDTVHVDHEADGIDFSARMISYKWVPPIGDHKGYYSQIEIGNYIPKYTDVTTEQVNKVEDQVKETNDNLDQTKEDLGRETEDRKTADTDADEKIKDTNQKLQSQAEQAAEYNRQLNQQIQDARQAIYDVVNKNSNGPITLYGMDGQPLSGVGQISSIRWSQGTINSSGFYWGNNLVGDMYGNFYATNIVGNSIKGLEIIGGSISGGTISGNVTINTQGGRYNVVLSGSEGVSVTMGGGSTAIVAGRIVLNGGQLYESGGNLYWGGTKLN